MKGKMVIAMKTRKSRSTSGADDRTKLSMEALAAIAIAAGVELSVEEATAWLSASSEISEDVNNFEVDIEDGIGGFELAVLDFDLASIERLRTIGKLIATRPRPSVQVGLAIA